MNKDITYLEYFKEKFQSNVETILDNFKEYNIDPKQNDTTPKIISVDMVSEIDEYLQIVKNNFSDAPNLDTTLRIPGSSKSNYLFVVYTFEVDIVNSVMYTTERVENFFENYKRYWKNFFDRRDTMHVTDRQFKRAFKQLNAGTLLGVVIDMYAVMKDKLYKKVPRSIIY